jgi:hypothetical protein
MPERRLSPGHALCNPCHTACLSPLRIVREPPTVGPTPQTIRIIILTSIDDHRLGLPVLALLATTPLFSRNAAHTRSPVRAFHVRTSCRFFCCLPLRCAVKNCRFGAVGLYAVTACVTIGSSSRQSDRGLARGDLSGDQRIASLTFRAVSAASVVHPFIRTGGIGGILCPPPCP